MKYIKPINEFWGDVLKRDLLGETREEDYVNFTNFSELRKFISDEIYKHKGDSSLKIPPCRLISSESYDGRYSPFRYDLYGSGIESLDLSSVIIDIESINCLGFFSYMPGVKTLGLPKFGNSEIDSLSQMFYKCAELEEIYGLNNLKTSGVKNFENMFYGCSALKSVDISKWDMSSAIHLSDMFSYSGIENIDLSGWKTDNVKNVSEMFSSCKNLKSVNMSGWNAENIIHMEGMFGMCSSLESVDMTGWHTPKLIDMSGLFNKCSSLNSVIMDNWVVGSNANITKTFCGCKSLKSLDVSGWNMEGVVKANFVFKDSGIEDTVDLTGWFLPNLEDASKICGKNVRFELDTDNKLKAV